MFEVPEVVVAKARVAGASTWVAELPDLVDALAVEWAFTFDATYEGGTEAFVAAVTLLDGTPAVLKLGVPRGDAARNEITVLRLTAGDGCVGLLRHDVARSAMLLERLGPSLFDVGLPLAVRLPILTDTATRVWRPAPDCGLPSGAAKGRWLVDHIVRSWEALDRPCAERTVEHAVACAERRIAAHDDERAVLVHGDVHQWNTLQAGDGWKLVDPDGMLAEPEYDLGILMREDPTELLAGHPFDRAAWLAARTGLDATAIWEWGVVERVSTGLICEQIGLQPAGREMLAAADTIALTASPS